ncbi:MAG: AAA family ATPase [Rhizobiaceae bacterium]
MQIARLIIENFRSISKLEVDFDDLTALVGSNNSGKSTILKAIELFFDSAPRVANEDHFMHDLSNAISISIEFANLTPPEKEEFSHAVSDGTLRVVREFGVEGVEHGEFSVYAHVNSVFEEFRKEKNGTTKRSLYAGLRPEYGLKAASGDEMENVLRQWETENPEKLQYGKISGFFGARNVALGKLIKKTSVRLVPAVKDAKEEVSDQRKSPVIGLLSEIVKQTFENKKEFVDFLEETNNKLAEITDPKQVPQLSGISDRLTSTLNRYYSDTSLVADLDSANEIKVNFPAPLVNVVHRGLQGDVSHVGHGLQRAIFFALVQFLAEEQATPEEGEKSEDGFSEPYSDIILLIEEPEIYQHPLKQVLFYEAFKDIVTSYNKSNGIRMQIAYATHSEKFVNIVDVDKVRLISKANVEEALETHSKRLSIAEFSSGMADHISPDIQPMPEASFKAGLHIFSREISEGFFADKVVLVEGVSDKAILQAAYHQRKLDPLHRGVALIQTDGKTKIDKPLFAFLALGIPAYTIFDNDSDKEGKDEKANAIKRNRLIQSILNCDNFEDYPVGCFPKFSAIPGNLENYLKAEMGDDYSLVKQEMCAHFHIGGNEASKSPAVVGGMLTLAKAKGYNFVLLDEMIDAISAL